MVFSPEPTSKHRPAGFSFAAVHAGLKADGSTDLAWLGADRPACVAACFAPDADAAPAAAQSRAHLELGQGRTRGVLVHAGVANVDVAGGEDRARTLLEHAARQLAVPPSSVLLCGTGERGRPLPDAMIEAVPALLHGAAPDRVEEFAAAIGTTDRALKIASAEGIVDGRRTRILGIAKGNRRVHPRFCTLLGFWMTDAAVEPATLRSLLHGGVAPIFDSIRIDGQGSPADTLMLLASGGSGGAPVAEQDLGGRTLKAGFVAVAQSLMQQVVEDGSDPACVLRRCQVSVSSARSAEQAEQVADCIALSRPLRQALEAGGDAVPVLRELLGSRPDVELGRVSVMVDGSIRLQRGQAVPREDGPARTRGAMASVRVNLGMGREHVTRWSALLP